MGLDEMLLSSKSTLKTKGDDRMGNPTYNDRKKVCAKMKERGMSQKAIENLMEIYK